MKTSKIMTMIASVTYMLQTIGYFVTSLSQQQLLQEFGDNSNVVKFSVIPLALAVFSLWYWFYLRKNERLRRRNKYAPVISTFFLATAIMLFFALPWLIYGRVYNL